MGFQYVFVPANVNEPMEELEYPDDIQDLQKDTFRTFIEQFFSKKGEAVDKAVLMAQLQERTGVNLKEKSDSGEVDPAALDHLLSMSSVEIFPVLLPTKASEFLGVNVYCDDKGVAKELELNQRVSGVVQQCGFPGQTFRGDCFIARVFDDNEDAWYRTDFTLKELSTDAEWVAATRKQRENRSSGDMKSLADKMGMQNPAHVNPGTLADATPKGETDQYHWRQENDEVEITFKKEGLQKSDAKQVNVVFQRQKLKVVVKGETLLDATLFAATQADECTWTLSDGVIQVTLTKAEDISWDTLLKE